MRAENCDDDDVVDRDDEGEEMGSFDSERDRRGNGKRSCAFLGKF